LEGKKTSRMKKKEGKHGILLPSVLKKRKEKKDGLKNFNTGAKLNGWGKRKNPFGKGKA